MWREFGECGPQFVRFKTKWAWFALVGDLPVSINEINAVRPTGVRLFGRVAEFVENGRELNPQFAHAGSCNKRTLFFIFGTGKDDLIFYVAFHLPDVARVCLGDVHHEKRDFVSVLIVEFVEGRNLPPEWRSSVTTKNHDYRLLLV